MNMKTHKILHLQIYRGLQRSKIKTLQKSRHLKVGIIEILKQIKGNIEEIKTLIFLGGSHIEKCHLIEDLIYEL
jgi:hypothetical protein